jgi:ADP-heptose:LPS heptosyltransferase
VLAPGSGSRTKNWPRAHWLALAAALPATAALAVVVGPTEQERDDPRTWAWPRPAQFLVDVAVVALASRLREASLFVGNDSGTTHLAAMLGLPTVALFGPSHAGVFSPQGPEVAVLQAPAGELAELAPATVLAAAVGLQSGSRARTRRQ